MSLANTFIKIKASIEQARAGIIALMIYLKDNDYNRSLEAWENEGGSNGSRG